MTPAAGPSMDDGPHAVVGDDEAVEIRRIERVGGETPAEMLHRYDLIKADGGHVPALEYDRVQRQVDVGPAFANAERRDGLTFLTGPRTTAAAADADLASCRAEWTAARESGNLYRIQHAQHALHKAERRAMHAKTGRLITFGGLLH